MGHIHLIIIFPRPVVIVGIRRELGRCLVEWTHALQIRQL
jgi:hypothetical protein